MNVRALLLLLCVSSFSMHFKGISLLSNLIRKGDTKKNATTKDAPTPSLVASKPEVINVTAPIVTGSDVADNKKPAEPVTVTGSSAQVDPTGSNSVQITVDLSIVMRGLALLGILVMLIHCGFEKGILTPENWKDRLETVTLCVVNIAVTAALLLSNKWLMRAEAFPFPVELAFIHTMSALMWAIWTYGWHPDEFPSFDQVLQNPMKAVKDVGIVTLFQSANVMFSNMVLMYASVTFVQLCKALKVAMIYLLSIICGTEVFDSNKAQLVTLIALFGASAVYRETSVTAAGAAFALMTSFSDCCRLVMQGAVLCGDKRYDPNTFVLLNATIPIPVFAVLISYELWSGSNLLSRFVSNLPFIMANATLAASVQIIVPRLISRINGLGYGVFNVIKDSSVLVTAFLFNNDQLQQSQALAYSACYVCILIFLLVKHRPSLFAEHGIIGGTIAFMTMPSNKAKLSG